MPTPETLPVDAPTASLAREPQQARSRRTLERLREAAWSLLEEGGPESVTVTGVSSAAGVSVGSFYARFEGKDELLGHLEAVALASALERWAAAVDRPGVDALELIREVASLYRTGPARQLLMLARADGRSTQRLDELQRAVAGSLASHLPGPAGATRLRAAALSAGARELALAFSESRGSWLFGDEESRPSDPDQAIVDALASLLGGAATHEADSDEVSVSREDAPHEADAAPTESAAEAPEEGEDRKAPEPDDPVRPPVELFDVWG
jgi:AcrR family transcriptional regulator